MPQARPRCVGLHRRPPGVTARCCGLAAALRHRHLCRVDGFPVLGLLRRLRPLPRPSGDGGPARQAGCSPGRASTEGFPCSLCAGRRGRCPALLRQHRREYAAGFPRGLPSRHQWPSRKSPPRSSGQRALQPGRGRGRRGGRVLAAFTERFATLLRLPSRWPSGLSGSWPTRRVDLDRALRVEAARAAGCRSRRRTSRSTHVDRHQVGPAIAGDVAEQGGVAAEEGFAGPLRGCGEP